MRRLLVALAACLCCGCVDEKAVLQQFAPKDHDQLAREFLNRLQHADYAAAHAMLEPTVAAQTAVVALEPLGQLTTHGELVAVELIGAHVGFFKPWGGEPRQQSNLTYQLQFAQAWVVASFVLTSTNEGARVVSAHLQPVPDSLKVLNRFTFENKTAYHYLFFGGVVAVPLVILTALVLCIRSRVRRRWLWIIFILFAFGKISLNWSTGQWEIAPVSFLLFGAAFVRASSYAPVILSFGVPLGALLFLLLRRWLQHAPRAEPSVSSSTESPPL